ncbi:lysophospholipid acyltransferase family protein [Capnocytophaga canimorsus]|uniref:lysophospholipid acyltransferase family protein n=1 Tax=Capnocytophaga canimorsus TaxID=28188 RepID=UPI00385C34A6
MRILILAWRIWFYLLTGLLIVLLIPFLLILISNPLWYGKFYWVVRNFWAKPILLGMGLFPKIQQEMPFKSGQSYMLVANHVSMIDIMLMMYCSTQPFVFVGKKELSKLPVFGYFYKRVAILVDRSDAKSRKQVYDHAKKRLELGLSICIFPEGGIPEEFVILDQFKDGAFRLAIEHQIPIVPVTFLDNKKRFPWRLTAGAPGRLRVHIHAFESTKGLSLEDKNALKNHIRNLILQDLISYQK